MQISNLFKSNSRKSDIFLTGFALLLIITFTILIGQGELRTIAYIVGGVFATLLVFLIYFQPQVGAYVLVLTIYTNISDIAIVNGFPSINKGLVALVFVSLISHYITKTPGDEDSFIKFTRNEILLMGYFVVIALSVFVAQDRELAFLEMVDYAKDLFILFCIILALKNWEMWRRSVWIMFLTVFVLALIGSVQSILNLNDFDFFGFSNVFIDPITDYEEQFRFMGPLDDPNLWGQVLVAMIPIGLYRVIYSKKPIIKLISAGMTVVIAFAVFITYSRGAFLAFALSLILIIFENKVKIKYVIMLGLFAALLFLTSPSGYTDRILSLFQLTPNSQTGVYSDASFRGRLSEMKVGMNMFLEHPVLGVGKGNYPNYYLEYAKEIGLEYRNEEREAHSLYIEILSETGVLGFMAFSAAITSILLQLNKVRKYYRENKAFDRAGWITSISISIITYLTSSIFLQGDYIRYFWMIIALSMAALQIFIHQEKTFRLAPEKRTISNFWS